VNPVALVTCRWTNRRDMTLSVFENGKQYIKTNKQTNKQTSKQTNKQTKAEDLSILNTYV